MILKFVSSAMPTFYQLKRLSNSAQIGNCVYQINNTLLNKKISRKYLVRQIIELVVILLLSVLSTIFYKEVQPMDTMTIIFDIVYAIGGALIVGIPTIICFISACKKYKKAMNAADKEAAMNDMIDQAMWFIENVEDAYRSVNDILKRDGSSAGALKQDSVISRLQQYAIEKGYTFDPEFWKTKINELVAFTKKVN